MEISISLIALSLIILSVLVAGLVRFLDIWFSWLGTFVKGLRYWHEDWVGKDTKTLDD